MKQWDVYLADVPFEDLPEVKLRPVIILEDSVIVVDCLKMTSQPPRRGEYVFEILERGWPFKADYRAYFEKTCTRTTSL